MPRPDKKCYTILPHLEPQPPGAVLTFILRGAYIHERLLFKRGLYIFIPPTFAYLHISNDSYRACIQGRALFFHLC